MLGTSSSFNWDGFWEKGQIEDFFSSNFKNLDLYKDFPIFSSSKVCGSAVPLVGLPSLFRVRWAQMGDTRLGE